MLPALLPLLLAGATVAGRYEATWDSIDSRPTPEWFHDAKFGVFVHWGVYSVPAVGNEWFWSFWRQNEEKYVNFMKNNYPPNFTYQEFAKQFRTELYEPNKWADIFSSAGAKYLVVTTKHHDGYALYPSNYSFSWNAKDVGPGKDLIGPLAKAIRNNTDIRFGIYHSMLEWFNPLYEKDKGNAWTTQTFAKQKAIPELKEIVELFRPEVVWSDGEWESPPSYWGSTEFLAWLFNDSPVKDSVAVNDRWGSGTKCAHGGFYDCSDHYVPGGLQTHKWESATTLDSASWGYRREAALADYRTGAECIELLVKVVSMNGNLLLNVGPTKEGMIPVIMEERLRQIGSWLKVNGEAIYSTRPWSHQNDAVSSNVWYTQDKNKTAVYAIFVGWPPGGKGVLGDVRLAENATVTMLGYQGQLKWSAADSNVTVQFPDMSQVYQPGWAWALRLTGVAN
ncbi:alpha-L-fucosidase-like [Bacillus rossius redtenbacheri]|uniref:alpha-L-fucosidase-like n=1 Tax=Bacillus rossius redtenbacheri TaxID=93214 RepID=UPI002FDE72E2